MNLLGDFGDAFVYSVVFFGFFTDVFDGPQIMCSCLSVTLLFRMYSKQAISRLSARTNVLS